MPIEPERQRTDTGKQLAFGLVLIAFKPAIGGQALVRAPVIGRHRAVERDDSQIALAAGAATPHVGDRQDAEADRGHHHRHAHRDDEIARGLHAPGDEAKSATGSRKTGSMTPKYMHASHWSASSAPSTRPRRH